MRLLKQARRDSEEQAFSSYLGQALAGCPKFKSFWKILNKCLRRDRIWLTIDSHSSF